MVFGPGVLALLWCGLAVSLVTVGAAASGLGVVVGWDPDDGSSAQLRRERRQLLIEAVLRVAFTCQLMSLFLFVVCVEHLHLMFTGAMCAVGTLQASPLGFPTLGAKLAAFLACGLWLVVARSSEGAAEPRLVRVKHLALIPVAVLVASDVALQVLFFTDLDPQIITSCCATVFGREAPGVAAGVASLPVGPSRLALLGSMGVTLLAGARSLRRGRSLPLFAASACLTGLVAAAAIVIWVAPAYYQLPTHHCPLCLLSREHRLVGYPLYAALLVAVVTGAGAGLVGALRALDGTGSMSMVFERSLCRISLAGFLVFSGFAVWPAVSAAVRLGGG